MNKIRNIWIVSLVLKLLLAALIPLSQDESYYWVWSKNLQLSYYDHPGFVAWLLKLGQIFESFGHAVRWPAVFLSHLTLLVWIFILKEFFDFEKVEKWLLLTLLIPFTGIGSIVVTPDLPLIFFWSTSTYCTIQILKKPSYLNYLLLGVSLGLGFCSKYHIVLFVPPLILFTVWNKKWDLLHPVKILVLAAAGLVACSPVLIWNFQNDFASFKFQLAHGFVRPEYSPTWTIEYIAAQILLITPFVFFAAMKKTKNEYQQLIQFLSFGTILFFLFTSFKAATEANWPIAAYLGFIALAVASANYKKIFKYTLYYWTLIYIVIGLALFVPNLEYTAKIKEPSQYLKYNNLVSEFQPLFVDSYQLASSLWYNTKTPVYKLRETNRFDLFDTLEGSTPRTVKFFMMLRTDNDLPKWITTEKWLVTEIKKIDSDYVLLEITKQ